MSANKTLLTSSSALGQQRGSAILVVDDDSSALSHVGNMLAAAGYQAHSETSAEAIGRRSDLDSFAAVLLDRQVEERVFVHIRESAPHLPIILMSPQADVREAVRALWRGASDYLIKPVTAAVLQMSLQQVLSQPRLEAAYENERAFSENLLDLAPSIVLVLSPEGRIVRFNRFMEELSGYRLDEVEGRNWYETFLPEEDRTRVREAVARVLQGGTVSGNVNPIVIRSGEQRQISWRCRTLTDADGNIEGILSIGQDVTELLEAQTSRVRTERLATIGQAIAAVSHEARNELYALKMGLDLLRQTVGTDLEVIAELEESQGRLTRLFEDVRAFAGPMKLESRPHNVPAVWRKAWASLENARQNRDAALKEDLFDPEFLCEVDSFRMEEVFRNLFENSLAACSGPVEIQITCTPATINPNDAVCIRVRDNGPGLTPDQEAKLFHAFFTTKSGGTGLGLALVKRIVEAHGGNITVNQENMQGTEFVITLPTVAAKNLPVHRGHVE